MKCSACDSPALALFRLPRGCIAFPELTEQWLCAQHIISVQPRDGIELVRSLLLPGSELPGGW